MKLKEIQERYNVRHGNRVNDPDLIKRGVKEYLVLTRKPAPDQRNEVFVCWMIGGHYTEPVRMEL
jgi:hypothetical protein